MAQAHKTNAGILTAFPLMIIVIVVYNILVVIAPITGAGDPAPGASDTETAMAQELADQGTRTLRNMSALLERGVTFPLVSGDIWRLRLADILLILGLTLLLLEVLRSTATTGGAIVNHALSLVLFIIALVEFIVLPGFGTSTFFMLTFMCLFDVVAGFTIGIVAARRDLGIAPGVTT